MKENNIKQIIDYINNLPDLKWANGERFGGYMS